MSFDAVLAWGHELWPHVLAILGTVAALVTSAHVILFKRDVRAATGWIGLIWLAPVLGVALYLLLGINRIHRRAGKLKHPADKLDRPVELPAEELAAALGPDHSHLSPLARLTQRVGGRSLTTGNEVRPLVTGDAAYPAMLDAVASAERSVCLSSYIFADDPDGREFVRALTDAKDRGVEVRVLVDAMGARYSWPRSVFPALRKAGIPNAAFLPTRVPWRMRYANLRNHRKILVVDGRTGFTGGMNIRKGNRSTDAGEPRTGDLHFSFTGPVVRQFSEVFAKDWRFTTGEVLEGERWFPTLSPLGDVLARGISDGPDDDLNKLRWAYLGGLDCARTSVRIITPYFLPDAPLIASLASASLRGVSVDIVLPMHNNLALVQWASMATLWQVLEHGCRIWLTPGPFDHTKLMVVDQKWSFVGSGNWDPRSLRLNFEFNVECYGASLGAELDRLAVAKIKDATELSLDDVESRSFPVKLRDGAARLLTPYL